MERQKQVKTNALTKVETFLNDVYLKIGKGETFSLDALAREHKLSGSLATLLKRQKIVSKIGMRKECTWQWIYPKQPDRALALVLMDEINRYNGNFQNKTPLLDKALSQVERPPNLFDPLPAISERVYIAACIAEGIYKNIPDLVFERYPERFLNEDFKGLISELNETVIFATNDLLTKIKNQKLSKNE